MKKSLLTMATIVALASCSQDNLMQGIENNADGVIGVKAYVPTITRGAALNNVGELVSEQNGFDLFAFLSGGTQFMGTTSDGTAFKGSGSEGAYTWDYNNKAEMKFWSEAGGKAITFYAVSPMSEKTTDLGNGSLIKDITADKQTLTYTVPSECKKQIDLMYAAAGPYSSDNYTANHVTNGIDLQFHHALSQIVFKTKTDNEYVYADVEKVEIKNLYGNGTFNFADGNVYSPNKEDAIFPWDYTNAIVQTFDAAITSTTGINTDAKGTTTATIGQSGKSANGAIALTESKNALLLLPQNLADNKASLEITCKVRYKRSDSDCPYIVGNENESKIISVPVATKWQPGYKYTYTLIFTADMGNPIKIKAVGVDQWNNGTNEDITVDESKGIEGLTYDISKNLFLINDADDLFNMNQLISENKTYTDPVDNSVKEFSKATYLQTADITIDKNRQWNRIQHFYGAYNGNGKTITGLNAMFIRYIHGVIENLHINVNCVFPAYNMAVFSEKVKETGIIRNCSADGNADFDGGGPASLVSINHGLVIGCWSGVNAKGKSDHAGGIVSNNSNDGKVIACYNKGNVYTTMSVAGGIVGMNSGSVIACYNTGNLSCGESSKNYSKTLVPIISYISDKHNDIYANYWSECGQTQTLTNETKVDGKGTTWTTAMAAMNKAIAECGVSEANGWSYIENSDAATKTTEPLKLKYIADND